MLWFGHFRVLYKKFGQITFASPSKTAPIRLWTDSYIWDCRHSGWNNVHYVMCRLEDVVGVECHWCLINEQLFYYIKRHLIGYFDYFRCSCEFVMKSGPLISVQIIKFMKFIIFFFRATNEITFNKLVLDKLSVNSKLVDRNWCIFHFKT